MSEIKSASWASEIPRLRKLYQRRLARNLADLKRTANLLVAPEISAAERIVHLDYLHQGLHRLAGSGGSFGFDELGKEARALEIHARAWLSIKDESPDPQLLEPFVEAVVALSKMNKVPTPFSTSLPMRWGMPTLAKVENVARIWLSGRDDLFGQAFASLLRQFGYEVRQFADLTQWGEEEGVPDVLVMDLQLLQDDPSSAAISLPDCPRLFIAAQGDFNTRLKAARYGGQGFFIPPLDLAGLIDRIEQILSARTAVAYRLLIVDDDQVLLAYYKLLFETQGFEVEVLADPLQFIECVSRFGPELIVLDLNMPACSGAELAAILRQHDEWLDIPVIFLSAESELHLQMNALRQGADDFLTKPLSDAQLVSSVRARVTRARQLSDLIARDSLTGLLKHARVKDELETQQARALRKASRLSVAMIDIDHFKRVNDTYGHARGDQVIKALAHLLSQRLRKSDVIGRYGGEEFVVILPECDVEEAIQVIDEIRQGFASLSFWHEEMAFACTFSAGIACNAHFGAVGGSILLGAADAALYEAKRGGRNQVRTARSEVETPRPPLKNVTQAVSVS